MTEERPPLAELLAKADDGDFLPGPGQNCNLLVAKAGEVGLATIRRHRREGNPIDLVLLDINMPAMDGFAARPAAGDRRPARHAAGAGPGRATDADPRGVMPAGYPRRTRLPSATDR